MNCPNCNTYNDSNSTFCMQCGAPLGVKNPQSPARNLLWIVTGRLVVAVMVLWVLRSVLTSLDFVKSAVIPGLEVLPVSDMINLAVFVAVILLLVGFLQALSRLWPQAYPRLMQALPLIHLVIYLILFNQIYKGISLIVTRTGADREIVVFAGLALVVAALILSVRAFMVVYQALPGWLASLSLDASQSQPGPKQ